MAVTWYIYRGLQSLSRLVTCIQFTTAHLAQLVEHRSFVQEVMVGFLAGLLSPQKLLHSSMGLATGIYMYITMFDILMFCVIRLQMAYF
jgi:hypothetical protein